MIEKQYCIAVRKRKDNDRFFDSEDFKFTQIRIRNAHRYWFADPFIFEKNGMAYLFYEAYDLVKQRGFIGYSVINDKFEATKPRIIIKGEHKSFPYIFEKNDDIYIMPESCCERKICLYKAVSFPDTWVMDKDIILNIFATDSIMISYDNVNSILTSEQYLFPKKEHVVSCWVKNRLMQLDDSFNVLEEENNGLVVSEGEEGIRNAGALFSYDGIQYRAGQNCKNGAYGKGIKFFKIITTKPYLEELKYEIDCDEMQEHILWTEKKEKMIGTHTYNSSDNYEVIDISYIAQISPWVFAERCFYRFAKKIYREMKKIVLCANKIQFIINKKLLYHNEEIYKSIVSNDAPWVFVSYIADPFYHQNNPEYMDIHQNKRETLAMADVFNRLGFNVIFMLYTSTLPIPNIEFKFIFGHDPNVSRAKKKSPNAKIIYYAVSTYYSYRNEKIKAMTKAFNNRFNVNIPEIRLLEPSETLDNSDYILLIGSDKTIETYPKHLRKKITKIHESTQNYQYLRFIDAKMSKEILYFASSGNILKGCQCIIDFFSKHPEYELHWVGPIEDDIYNVIKDVLTDNIHVYGFLNINSDIMLGIMERCDFIIYPSGVEGVPGSVLNAMKSGLIPIVTPYASFDGIDDLGYLMNDSTVEEIDKAMIWADNLSKDEVLKMKKSCQRFVLEHYNLERFSTEFEEYFKNIINI